MKINIEYDEGNNWVFTFVDAGAGKKVMAVF